MKKMQFKLGDILTISGVILLVFLILYLMTDYLLMPLYTRKWQKVTVPDVTRYSQRVAAKMLKKNGLQLIVKEEKFDINYPPGYVLFQNPEPGSRVKKGRRIYLTVGKGYKTLEMPRLVSEPLRDALFILSKNQLSVGRIDSNYSQKSPGVVFAQSIAPGELVSVETKIDLHVSLGTDPEKILVPELVGKSREDALVEINLTGLVLGGYEYQFTDKILPNTVLGQIPAPGTHVAKHDTVFLTLSRLPEKTEEEIPWQQ